MGRIITCKNEDGLSIRFGYGYTPWLLLDCDGIYLSDANVYTSDNTMTDGATYQGTTLKMRNILLTMEDRTGHRANRQLLYNVFKPKAPGLFLYEEEGETRQIGYYVESVEISTMGAKRTATVSLLCPDPYFVEDSDTRITIAGWEGLFEFSHEFCEEGELFGQKSEELLKTITNDTAADHIGMTISITAWGDVMNPSVTCVETQKTIRVGTAEHPLKMVAGDEVRITTGTNKKNVCLIRDGVSTGINEYLDEESEFIQLMRGDNTLGYEADAGAEYISILIAFRYKFPGV